MKVYTIETCGDCPLYHPSSAAYCDEFGECRSRKVNNLSVERETEPPRECPLKDWGDR